MKKMFQDLWDDKKCNKLKKQELVGMVVQRLETIKGELERDGRGPTVESVAAKVNWQEWRSHQKGKKKAEEESFKAKRDVFQSCGRQIAERKRWQCGMGLDEEDMDCEEGE